MQASERLFPFLGSFSRKSWNAFHNDAQLESSEVAADNLLPRHKILSSKSGRCLVQAFLILKRSEGPIIRNSNSVDIFVLRQAFQSHEGGSLEKYDA